MISIVLTGSLYAWKVGVFTPLNEPSRGYKGHSHSHADLEPVKANRPYPTLDVSLKNEDRKRVLYLETNNFTFKSAVDPAVKGPNPGSDHLNADEESFVMFYANRYVLSDFMPGTYTSRVTLNADESHASPAVNGNVVSDAVLPQVQPRERTTDP